ncbi:MULTISPECIES: restriction endonuclease subunit S [Acinetobacter]|uniref:restriction endonuclease subunit S n=1 Tax=Acinetobacter TaxID=469 RepID=UPI00196B9F36|nr:MULTISPECIES: restriction endonuclease subunit S [Acinetobacter]MDH1690165.1 restriction endonuclease subunit S [Acinetobacter junii]
MEKLKYPEVRFNGHSESWSQQPLNNIFGKIRNAFVGTATPFYVKKGNFYLESNNVKNGKINKNTQIFIDDYFYFKQRDKWLKTNDIVMVQSGHVGHSAVISEELNNSAAHALIMFSDYKVQTDPHFLNYQWQTNSTKNAIEKIATGNTIRHILSSDMKEFLSFFSSYDEQTQIGNFFQNLDQSIALHEKKLAQTQNLKKAMLEKMFPKAGSKQPEIRLKGFSGDWEKKLLDNEVEFFSGLTYSPDDLTNKNGTLVLRSSNVQDNQIFMDDNVYVVHDAVNVCNVEVGDIIVVVRNGSRSLIGKHAVINKQMKNTVIGAFMTGVKAKNPYFINALFDTCLFDLAVSRNLGATINQITTGMFKQMEFKFPDKTEQIAIGQFFKQLDETLVLQQQQLQTLKNLKQAFLEKMFV